jgi:hypothetical protein
MAGVSEMHDWLGEPSIGAGLTKMTTKLVGANDNTSAMLIVLQTLAE